MTRHRRLSAILAMGGTLLLGATDGGAPVVADPVSALTYAESDGRFGADAPADALGKTVPDEDAITRAVTRSRLQREGRGTYIDELLLRRDSALARWRKRAAPLTVWIQPSAAIQDFSSEFAGRVRQAFERWDGVGLDGLHFAFVADSTRANVRVTWTDHFKDPISGRTRWARNGEWWITEGSIVLAVHHSQGEPLNAEAVGALALHEVGHLIGLDHTSDTTNVMAAKVRVRTLSNADEATARLLYTLPAGGIR